MSRDHIHSCALLIDFEAITNETLTAPTFMDPFPHRNISRQLDEKGARSVVDLLVSTGHAEWNGSEQTT